MVLIFSAGSFKLDCADSCPFARKCPEKFNDGTCQENIQRNIRNQVHGTPGLIETKSEGLKFTTSNPDGKIQIYGGWISVER